MNKNPILGRKRLLSLLTTGILAASMVVSSASAAKITIAGLGDEYKAYRLLDLTTSLKTDDHVEHEGDHNPDCWNYAYTVNPKYQALLQGIATDADGDGAVSDEEILKYISGMESNSDAIREFADSVFAGLGEIAADAVTTTSELDIGDEQGYYLIAETKRATGEGQVDSVSLVMLDTAGQDNIQITAKEGVPTLVKKIVMADGTLVDADSVAYGDTVKYRLTATLPSNLDGYDTYKLIFHDEIDAGLTLKAGTVTMKVGETDVEFVQTETPADNCGLELVVADIKSVAGVAAESEVVVEYECLVADAAVMGETGNKNIAQLEFSADPYDASVMGFTLQDKVKVFTFGLTITKVDKNGNQLPGADFKLQKKGADGEYADFRLSGAEDGATVFTFNGLDEGQYRIVETTVPAGYVEADPVEFEIDATFDVNSADPSLTALAVKNGAVDLTVAEGVEGTEGYKSAAFTATLTSGVVATRVLNIAGNRMPITGGAGTYAIYAGGAVLVLLAGGAVVLKKRKVDAE